MRRHLDLRSTSFDVDIVLGYNAAPAALRIDYRRREIGLAHPDLGALALGPYAQQLPPDSSNSSPRWPML
ncbi:MAG: hypothetical protein U0Z44_21180 [Kouleothrix sp.]